MAENKNTTMHELEPWPDMAPAVQPTPDPLAERLAEQIETAQTAIARQVQEFEQHIATARGYAPEIAIAEAFCRAFPPTENSYHQTMRTHLGIGPHVLNGVLISWDAKALADVTPRVAWLAQRLGKFKIDDYAEMGRRTYDFGRLKLMVFFNSYDNATVCRFVQVGVEDKPIYKLMCGEGETKTLETVAVS